MAQLHELGMSTSAITARARCGRLHRVHRGVYAVGHDALSWHARVMAAVLAVGGDALVSGRAAAALHGIERRMPRRIDIVTTRRHRGFPDVHVHVTTRLPNDERTERAGIPVATVPRLFVDLAERESSGRLANLMHEADFHEVLDVGALERAARRHASRHGNPTLVVAIELHRSGQAGTMSRLEEVVVARLVRAGASMPQVNPRVCGLRCDLYWPAARLVVEVDGPGHDRARTRRADAARTARLESADIDVMRVRFDAIDAGVRAVLRRLRDPGRA